MDYDVIIIGAGPAGLFAAANTRVPLRGLILHNMEAPGKKLLLAGGGKCNLTQAGSIKDFLLRYGDQGPRLRRCLYGFSNTAVVDWFQERGLSCITRENGKVFPASLSAEPVLELLLKEAKGNGYEIRGESVVDGVRPLEGGGFVVHTTLGDWYSAKQVVLATGGLSYPRSGSDGSIRPVLEALGLKGIPQRPALTPLFVEGYPFGDLSGISFSRVQVRTGKGKTRGSMLLTHRGFSGPAILDASRYAYQGGGLWISYVDGLRREDLLTELKKAREGGSGRLLFHLQEGLGSLGADLPRRFLERQILRCGLLGEGKMGEISNEGLSKLATLLTEDPYVLSGDGGFGAAMCTTGGVDLGEVDLGDFQAKAHPGLYLIGEMLDVDGDTGGYNLQFAFSSGLACGVTLGGTDR